MEEYDDETLMLRVRDGEIDRLATLFDRYSGILFTFFFRRTQDKTLSEDLTQDVFLRILRYRKSFRVQQTGSFRSWLFTIARNTQNKHWQKSTSAAAIDLENSPERNIVDQEKTPDAHARLSDETALLYQALESLPEDKRQLVIMRRIQDLSYDEISRTTGCPPQTLKVRVHRAVAELTEILNSLIKERPHELPGM